jgi:hypothetical protein
MKPIMMNIRTFTRNIYKYIKKPGEYVLTIYGKPMVHVRLNTVEQEGDKDDE